MKIGRYAVIALALTVGLSVAPSLAGCPSAFLLSTWGSGSTGVYNNIHLGAGLDPATVALNATFWQQGSKATFNSGTLPSSEWLIPYPPYGPDAYYIMANTGDDRVVGCGTAGVYTQVEALGPDGTYKFFIGGITQHVESAIVWDYSRLNTDWNLVQMGRMSAACQSTASNCHYGGVSTTGTTNAMSFTQPNGIQAAFFAGDIPNPVASWKLMRKDTNSTTTDTTTTGWTQVGTAPLGSPILYQWDDSTVAPGNYVHFAGQAVLDGGQGSTGWVGGEGTSGTNLVFRGNNPTLANPKFKNIDKRHKK